MVCNICGATLKQSWNTVWSYIHQLWCNLCLGFMMLCDKLISKQYHKLHLLSSVQSLELSTLRCHRVTSKDATQTSRNMLTLSPSLQTYNWKLWTCGNIAVQHILTYIALGTVCQLLSEKRCHCCVSVGV